jgi:uncharacterized protein (DUF433 family)
VLAAQKTNEQEQRVRLSFASRRIIEKGIIVEQVSAMTEKELYKHIVVDKDILAGKPVIRGTRLAVEFIVGLLAKGATTEDILMEYPGLTREDIRACLLFAAKTLEDTEFTPFAASE